MANYDSAYGLTTARVTIGGSTCVGITAGPGCNGYLVGFLTGGTCSLSGVSSMSTGYVLTTTPLAIGGPSAFFLNELNGVTTIVQIIKTLSSYT